MEYDKELLKSWCKMPDWASYLDRNGALNRYSSKEGFQHIEKEYFNEVKRRIDYCKRLLREHEDVLIHYTLAELYDRYNVDESPLFLYKKPVRYYALKALEIDSNFIPAKELLKKADEWVEYLGGDKDYMPELEISFENQDKRNFENNA